MNWKQVKSIKIKEGDVKSLSINSQVVWKKEEVPPQPVRPNAFRFYNPGDAVNTLSVAGSPSFETSADGVNWTPDAVFTSMDIQPRGTLYLRGKNATMKSKTFSSTQPIECHGSVMDLCDGGTDTIICTDSSQFSLLFANMTTLLTAPELPATTLANYCYHFMFNKCTSLATAPELPATQLANYCYNHMFDGCNSLATAPELPATTLAAGCYSNMFYGCRSLNYVKVGATSWIEDNSDSWLESVASVGVFEKPAELVVWKGIGERPVGSILLGSSWGIPTNWKVKGPRSNAFGFKNVSGTPNTLKMVKSTELAPEIILEKSSDSNNYEPCDIYSGITLQPEETIYLRGSNKTMSDGFNYNSFSSTGSVESRGVVMDLCDEGTDTNDVEDNYQFAGLFQNMSTLMTTPVLPDIDLHASAKNLSVKQFRLETGVDPSRWIILPDDASTKTLLDETAGDAKASEVANIGFDFVFGGVTYTQFSVNTDGNLRLGSVVTERSGYSTPFGKGDISKSLPKINAFGCDGKMVAGGYVKCNTIGSAPNRVLVVEYKTAKYNWAAKVSDVSWQVQLFETSDEIQFVYSGVEPDNPPNSFQIGMASSTEDVITINTSTNSISKGTTEDKNSKWPAINTYYYFHKDEINLECFKKLFKNCSNINSVKINTKEWYDQEEWLSGVANTGDLQAPNLTFEMIPESVSGCPTGWTLNGQERHPKPAEDHRFRFKNVSGAPNTLKMIKNGSAPAITLEKSADGKVYEPCDIYAGIEMQPNETVYLRGNNPTMSADGYTNNNQFSSTADIECHGSVMDLCDGGTDTLVCSKSYQFGGLFMEMRKLKTPPELPATKLSVGCYLQMFLDCSALIQAPDLPANNLNLRCYLGMFRNCKSLTTAPELPATKLQENCYESMFYYCFKLNYIKVGAEAWEIPVGWDINYPSDRWLESVASTGTFVKPTGLTDIHTESNDGIPSGWVVENV